MSDDLIHTFEVAFDAAEAGSGSASTLRRQFISKFCEYFEIDERDLVTMGRKITLGNLDYSEDAVGDIRLRAIDSLQRNIPRLKPHQPGVHEDVRRTEVAYCYKRILDSFEKIRNLVQRQANGPFFESDLSSWVASYTSPEPVDPNDRLRQKTQTRADIYPYDKPVSYGAPRHTGMDGDERQVTPSDGPPMARQHRAPRAKNVWEMIDEVLDCAEIGPSSPSAAPLGYGNHGRMGEDGMDAFELEMDSLQRDFRSSYEGALPATDTMGSTDLFSLLSELDPDFAAETFAPEDEEEMRSIYGLWADKMSGHEE